MIVVTGATGHIGNVLVRKITQKGDKVRVIVPPNEDIKPIEDCKDNIEILRGDIRDKNFIVKALKNATVVFHLASAISIKPQKDKKIYDINVKGTENIIEGCIKNNVKRLVYTSSVHALREPPIGTPIDETCPFDPEAVKGFYAKTKAIATLKVIKAAKNGLNAVIGVPAGVIGPFDFRLSEMGKMIKDTIMGKLPIYIKGRYNFVDVRDVAYGLILLKDKGKAGESFIFAGDILHIEQLLKWIQEFAKAKIPKIYLPYKLSYSIGYILSYIQEKPIFTPYSVYVLKSNANILSTKAEKELTWHHRSLKESIKDTVVWLINNNIK